MQFVDNISFIDKPIYQTDQTFTEQCPYLVIIIPYTPYHLQHHSACSILQFIREFSPYFWFTTGWDSYFGRAKVISLALVEDANIQYCQTVCEFQERFVKVARTLSGIHRIAYSVAAESRTEQADDPFISCSLIIFLSCRLMSFTVVHNEGVHIICTDIDGWKFCFTLLHLQLNALLECAYRPFSMQFPDLHSLDSKSVVRFVRNRVDRSRQP
ncbi:MAG: hypothetical protein EZS28_008133 [Streblomastix strix]|uniref:Uncharacterized protein n=1 Tax=Streblomastix strix TaxID=222440 RepID=A0A5J4WNE4_9EUKA|nr:MAG: hypothetical protein EZS28_008133 [Streblomastix strix]